MVRGALEGVLLLGSMGRRELLPVLLYLLALVFGCGPGELEKPPGGDTRDEAPAKEGATAEAPLHAPRPIESPDLGEDPLARHFGERYPASLESVIEKRFLRVLTSRNEFDFFIHRGKHGGLQYEMVRDFTAFLNERHVAGRRELPIQFELIPVDDDQLIPLLLEGAADLIAARLTITPERAERVRFSRPYRKVDELIVSHDAAPEIRRPEDLAGRQVAVRASSSYHASLRELSRRLVEAGHAPVEIESVDEALETEGILALVAARRYPHTVADSIVARLAVAIHPRLRIAKGFALREGGELAWATLPSASGLAEEANLFLRRYAQGTLLGNIAIQKHFEVESGLIARFAEDAEPTLCEFDALFRQHATELGLDWRLVAAMAYQESRFDPLARSRKGAVGLLQIKPVTAREPYVGIQQVEGREHVSDNVRAGLRYLMWIKQRYFDSEPGIAERDRLRMALAAYNAGPRSVQRARQRAAKQGLDSNRWFRNVELAMLQMGLVEPVKYVSEINQRYLGYILLGLE
jgi:membrane-bound lytic murein transglycosylase MltF